MFLRKVAFGSAVTIVSACAAGGSEQPPAAAPPPPQGQWSVEEEDPVPEPIQAMPVEAATTPPAPNENPFVGAEFFLDQRHVKNVESTIADAPKELHAKIKKVATFPTALWMDRIEAVKMLPGWLEAAKAQSKKSGKPVVPVIVVYDLPNRDCSAKASAGELKVEEGGEQRYRTEYIDAIAAELAKFPELKVAAVVEPDSLPNVATNMNVEHCAKSADIYKHSIAYTISKLSLPNVYLYLDAAHAGWLGWIGNREKMGQIFKDVVEMAGGPDRIRGFATNVSNYNALEGDWGKKLEPSNPCGNELDYVDGLTETFAKYGFENKGVIVDTSRNGVQETRTKWGHWCNVKGAGLGERPKVAPREHVDAYYWVKPPGDSDGVSDPNAPRFDEFCASPDSAENAPQAGQWFTSYFIDLVKNANPPL